MSNPVLILAGINNSGPTHWQSLWQKRCPEFVKVEHRDWDNPVCADWIEDIERAVQTTGAGSILVAHSLACLAVAHWTEITSCQIKAAMLVSVPDPLGVSFPKEAKGFENPPLKKFNFESVVVASSNDPYGSVKYMKRCAAAWGSGSIELGAYGHINASSGLGEWPEGYAIFSSLRSKQ